MTLDGSSQKRGIPKPCAPLEKPGRPEPAARPPGEHATHPHARGKEAGTAQGAKMQPDYSKGPRIIAWEVTRACNLACKHCRAAAMETPDPDELSTAEAMAFLDSLPAAGSPMIILTGGEPLMRRDIFKLADHARGLGLRCVMAPNGTLLTPENAAKIKDHGIMRCSISLDGPTPETHDEFRGVPGAFEASLRGIEYLKNAGVEFQINTTVTKETLPHFDELFALTQKLGAAAWHIFLLVPVGRGAGMGKSAISAAEYEKILNRFYDLRRASSMHLKATCAPHYYRIMRERAASDNLPVNMETFGMDAVTRGCLAGTGFCFVSHTGTVQPCGYLELDCGSIRDLPFPELWQKSRPLSELRDQRLYTGKCGPCEYHKVCGGCRARAMTMTGSHLAPEPLCTYTPANLRKRGL